MWTKSQKAAYEEARRRLVPQGWTVKGGTRNLYFYSPSGKRRLVIKQRNIRSEKLHVVDHGDSTQKIWVGHGSVTNAEWLRRLAAKDAEKAAAAAQAQAEAFDENETDARIVEQA